MRSLIWITLFLVGLSGVLLPLLYLYKASQLPRLESEYDLETLLRLSIEGERISTQAGKIEQRPTTFEKPDFSKLPKDLVALYISQIGCPGYFQSPREEGPRWATRLLVGALDWAPPAGDGRCERYMALRLANFLGVNEAIDLSVAANKLHGFLAKDQLIAYDMATMRFERGIVGLREASWKLYGKYPENMTLAELSELALAFPVNGFYKDLRSCKNASLIRQARDGVLQRLQRHALVSEARAREAMAAPVACVSVP